MPELSVRNTWVLVLWIPRQLAAMLAAEMGALLLQNVRPGRINSLCRAPSYQTEQALQQRLFLAEYFLFLLLQLLVHQASLL